MFIHENLGGEALPMGQVSSVGSVVEIAPTTFSRNLGSSMVFDFKDETKTEGLFVNAESISAHNAHVVTFTDGVPSFGVAQGIGSGFDSQTAVRGLSVTRADPQNNGSYFCGAFVHNSGYKLNVKEVSVSGGTVTDRTATQLGSFTSGTTEDTAFARLGDDSTGHFVAIYSDTSAKYAVLYERTALNTFSVRQTTSNSPNNLYAGARDTVNNVLIQPDTTDVKWIYRSGNTLSFVTAVSASTGNTVVSQGVVDAASRLYWAASSDKLTFLNPGATYAASGALPITLDDRAASAVCAKVEDDGTYLTAKFFEIAVNNNGGTYELRVRPFTIRLLKSDFVSDIRYLAGEDWTVIDSDLGGATLDIAEPIVANDVVTLIYKSTSLAPVRGVHFGVS